MEGGPLSTEEFAEFGNEVVLFCHITTRVDGDKDQDLLRKMGGRGFPTLMWLDAEGEQLAMQGDRTVDGFRKTGEALIALQKLEKADRTEEQEVEYFLARIALGQMDFAAAQEAAKKLKAKDELAAQIDAALLNLEIEEKIKSVRDRDAAAAAGKDFAEMAKAGRVPTAKGVTTAQFWMMVSEHAYDESDTKLFEQCITKVKEALGDNKRYARVFQTLDQRLEELKK